VGVDIEERYLKEARDLARHLSAADRCVFMDKPDENADDVIVTIDSFEHSENPAAIFEQMYSLLRPKGCTRFDEVEGGLNRMTFRRDCSGGPVRVCELRSEADTQVETGGQSFHS
jgi:2-polyprenyl-3-methyl-5-hydroxy-6-metoxy-1,4-benzoquinol methylase